jgi:outer membrane receptor protein involved in Fe transport
VLGPPLEDGKAELAAWAAQEFARNDPAAMAALWDSLAAQDHRPLLPRITQPTLIVRGVHSYLYGEGTSRYLASALPHARLIEFGRSGHAPALEEPELFNSTIRSFVAELQVRGRNRNDRMNRREKMSRHSRTALKLGCAAAALLAAATPGLAQVAQETEQPAGTAVSDEQRAVAANEASEDEATQGQELVVTARRRAESLQDVPIAVTAYSGEALERQGAIDITDISDTTPNVTLETSRGTNTTLTAFIRGVGQQDPVAGFEAGVGLYLDDVFLNRPQAAVLDIYDVERIEVLRGPQGTLYGRNTIGGAIKYVTRRLDDEPTLRMRANLGTYDQADLILTTSYPLSEAIRVGVSGARLSRGGFGDNLNRRPRKLQSRHLRARGTIEIEPTPASSSASRAITPRTIRIRATATG